MHTPHPSRSWLRRPRTLIAAGIAVALLVTGGVVLLSREDSTVTVVQEYFDAIHSGDTAHRGQTKSQGSVT